MDAYNTGKTLAMSQKDTMDALEAMIDIRGIDNILSRLSEICYEKAEHLRENWQDENAAKNWEKSARKLERISL